MVKADSTVWTWGQSNYGQLGDGTTTNRATPDQVMSLNGVVAGAAGTSPVDPDTDGDGLLDGAELSAGRDPILNESAVILLINSMEE